MDSLLKKLQYKSGTALLLNAPQDIHLDLTYDPRIQQDEYDFVVIFAENQSVLSLHVPELMKVIKENTIFWVAFPKKNRAKTDISRDEGWKILTAKSFRSVRQISMNEVWSALRFRPLSQVRTNSTAETKIFEAIIEGSKEQKGGAWVTIPFSVKEVFGASGIIPVKATFDDCPYQGSLANMGTGGHILIIKKEVRKRIGKEIGDQVVVTLKPDRTERKIPLPDELITLLNKDLSIKEFYDSLSFTNRKEYATWISSAKKEETKIKRLKETQRRLAARVKNPFQKMP